MPLAHHVGLYLTIFVPFNSWHWINFFEFFLILFPFKCKTKTLSHSHFGSNENWKANLCTRITYCKNLKRKRMFGPRWKMMSRCMSRLVWSANKTRFSATRKPVCYNLLAWKYVYHGILIFYDATSVLFTLRRFCCDATTTHYQIPNWVHKNLNSTKIL